METAEMFDLGYVQSQHGALRFATVSGLNDLFP